MASARSLLLTVLGELVLPRDEPVWTGAFLDVLGALGVEPKTTRQAIARIADDGWLEASRDGRRTAWRLTPTGRELLTTGARRIYAHASSEASWDGRWLVVLAHLPERDRRARHLLQTRLAWNGLGRVASDVWVGAHIEHQPALRAALEDAGVAESVTIFVSRLGELGNAGHLAQQAWDLDDVERRYEEFIDAVRLMTPRTNEQALLALVRMVQEWRRFPFVDPDLPRDLLPPKWRGHEAAALFAERRRRWLPKAEGAWDRLRDARLTA